MDRVRATIAAFGHGGEQLHNVRICVALALLHQGPQPQARAIDREPDAQRSWGLATRKTECSNILLIKRQKNLSSNILQSVVEEG